MPHQSINHQQHPQNEKDRHVKMSTTSRPSFRSLAVTNFMAISLLFLSLWSDFQATAFCFVTVVGNNNICRHKNKQNLSLLLLSRRKRESSSTTTNHPFGLQASTTNSGNNNSNNSYNNNSNVPSSSRSRGKSHASMARESAVLVDWEPVSELERRIEDGMHYEHWPASSSSYSHKNDRKHPSSSSSHDAATPTVRGVFCGYRMTDDEYSRLKSAHPTNDGPID